MHGLSTFPICQKFLTVGDSCWVGGRWSTKITELIIAKGSQMKGCVGCQGQALAWFFSDLKSSCLPLK